MKFALKAFFCFFWFIAHTALASSNSDAAQEEVEIGQEDIVSLRNGSHPGFTLIEGTIPEHEEFFKVLEIEEGEDDFKEVPLWKIKVYYKRQDQAPESSLMLDHVVGEYIFDIIIAERVHAVDLRQSW